MKAKKVIAIILTIVILGGAATGGVFGYKAYQSKKVVAEVQPVSNISSGYWGDENYSSGMVTNNTSQEIYLTDSKTIEEIFVKEGDTVAVGDPLMSYDTAEVSIQIKQKQLDISTIENDMAIAQHNLDVLKNTTPVNKTKPATVATPAPTVQDTQPDLPQTQDSVPSGPEISESGAYNYVTGTTIPSNQAEAPDGTTKPFSFLCTPDGYVTGSYLNTLIANKTTAVFEIREGNTAAGNLIASWTINGAYVTTTYDESAKYFISTHEAVTDEMPDIDFSEPVPEEPIVEEWVEPEGYSAEELATEIGKQQATLKTLDIKKRKAELELESLQQTSDDGTVYATVAGTVKTVGDQDEFVNDGSAFLVVSGSDGLYVTGAVSELLLDQIGIGTVVTANSWESGMSYEATITEIADYPQEGDSYYGEGNSNASYYPYTAYIEDTSGLRNGEYLDLTITTGADAGSALFIEKAYVREEDGQSYVMVANEDEKLEKRYVTTGKTIYGSAVEITSGLTQDDRIAFPYGKTAIEGANVKEASNNYYY